MQRSFYAYTEHGCHQCVSDDMLEFARKQQVRTQIAGNERDSRHENNNSPAENKKRQSESLCPWRAAGMFRAVALHRIKPVSHAILPLI